MERVDSVSSILDIFRESRGYLEKVMAIVGGISMVGPLYIYQSALVLSILFTDLPFRGSCDNGIISCIQGKSSNIITNGLLSVTDVDLSHLISCCKTRKIGRAHV